MFGILRQNNPELTGERRRTILKPPQIAREGTKKTVFINFIETCKSLKRNHEHVQAFLLAELGTSGELWLGGGLRLGYGRVLYYRIALFFLCTSLENSGAGATAIFRVQA